MAQNHHRYWRRILIGLCLIILAVTPSAFGEEPKDKRPLTTTYDFDIVDLPVVLNDINDKREVIATQLVDSPKGRIPNGLLIHKKKNTTTPVSCGSDFGEEARSVNDKGTVAGGCFDLPSSRGFIRDSKGRLSFLEFPGSVRTEAFGINDRNQVVGQYDLPLQPGRSGFFRFHGFLWEKGKFTTIDVPVDNSVTQPSGINNRGQIVGHYFTFDPDTNEPSVAHGFFYDNGNFTTIDFPADDSTQLLDINNDGVLLGQSGGSLNFATSFGPPVPFLFDDGEFFVIGQPEPSVPGAQVSDFIVSGFNDRLQIVGRYVEVTGTPPNEQFTVFRFIATPSREEKRVKKR